MVLSWGRDEQLAGAGFFEGKGWVHGVFGRGLGRGVGGWRRRRRRGWEGDGVHVGVAELTAGSLPAENVGFVGEDSDGVVRARES